MFNKLNHNGFTLIELICCIGIISILITICIPNVDTFQKIINQRKFESFSNNLLLDIRYSKISAMTLGEEVEVKFFNDYYVISSNKKILKKVEYAKHAELDVKESTIPNNKQISFTEIGTICPYACTVVFHDIYGNKSSISIRVGSASIDYSKT